jgi:hypothetical protein
MSELKTRLVVDAGHPAVRIEVLDAEYRVRVKGYGRIDEELPTGFYTIQYKAADAMEERNIALRPNEPLTVYDPPDLPFASAAPLTFTSTSHEYHQHNAQRLSRSQPLERGSGSQIFVFVRDIDPGGSTHPAKGLSLHALDGGLIVQFDEVIEASRGTTEARWGGRNIAVDPGFYRLRLRLSRGKAIEMMVPACSGWQSQVFLLRQGGESEIKGKTVLDLTNASQLMARPNEGFDPWDYASMQKNVQPEAAGEDLRLLDLARQALAMGYRGIRASDLNAMLWGKWEDPLLGILGLHLLLRQPEPDLEFADNVLQRLRGSILRSFRHPDIDALALDVARRRGTPIEMPPFETPPMLRQSWNILVDATAKRPGLILPGSLAFQIADRLWGTGAWLIWQVPLEEPVQRPDAGWAESFTGTNLNLSQSRIKEFNDRVIIDNVTVYKYGASKTAQQPQVSGDEDLIFQAPPPPAPAPEPEKPEPTGQEHVEPPATEISVDLADFDAVRHAIENMLFEAKELTDQAELEKLARKAKFTEIEYALLLQFRGQFASRQRKFETQKDPMALENLVLQFGIPAEMIQKEMADLYVKLLALLPPPK